MRVLHAPVPQALELSSVLDILWVCLVPTGAWQISLHLSLQTVDTQARRLQNWHPNMCILPCQSLSNCNSCQDQEEIWWPAVIDIQSDKFAGLSTPVLRLLLYQSQTKPVNMVLNCLCR